MFLSVKVLISNIRKKNSAINVNIQIIDTNLDEQAKRTQIDLYPHHPLMIQEGAQSVTVDIFQLQARL
jgi:predicted SnoaL-like aldol condensation-catalyzing enzyme